jgi:hypothetical protein
MLRVVMLSNVKLNVVLPSNGECLYDE